MTKEEFADWAAEHGVTDVIIQQVTLVAATPEIMKAAEEAIVPPPPIYTLEDIIEMTQARNYGFWPLEHGLLLIGACPNGDPIAIDIADAVGSVLYIDHTSMHNTAPRNVAIRVADDVENLLNRMAYEDGFPIDYYGATQKIK